MRTGVSFAAGRRNITGIEGICPVGKKGRAVVGRAFAHAKDETPVERDEP